MDEIIGFYKEFPGNNDFEKALLAFLFRINQNLGTIRAKLTEMNGDGCINVAPIANCLNAISDCARPIMQSVQDINNSLGQLTYILEESLPNTSNIILPK